VSARILVVDDIETNRRLLEARLTAEYFDVLMAEDGPSCLDLARSQKPDVILLDVMMPRMDGFETCRRLKADPATRHIPVVMVTALDQRSDRIRGLEAGADEFLTKPVDDVALFARVRSLLRLTSVMDELRQRESSGVEMSSFEPANGGGRVIVAAADQNAAQRIVKALPESITVADGLRLAGAVGKLETIDVKIPAGIEDGKKIRLRGQGETAPGGVPPGDMLITVRVAAHPCYSRQGADLIVRVPISVTEAVNGTKVDIPTPKGTITMTVPPGTSSGKRLRAKGHGVATAEKTGDLLAEIQIVLPETIDASTKSELAKLDLTPSGIRDQIVW